MKKLSFVAVVTLLLSVTNLSAQGWWDYSSGMEFIFSSANVEGSARGTNYDPNDNSWSSTISENKKSPVRYTMFFHFQALAHYNFGKSAGIFTGLTCRNIGFTQNQASTSTTPEFASVYRTYTVGIPLAFKVGNMEKHFSFYAGAEAGFAFNYKEKHFNGNNRQNRQNRKTEWFSGRTNWFQPQIFAGIQLPGGANIKFAYYLNNFFNEDFTEYSFGNQQGNPDDPSNSGPYEGVNVNIFYTSVSFQLFKSDEAKNENKNTGGATAFR